MMWYYAVSCVGLRLTLQKSLADALALAEAVWEGSGARCQRGSGKNRGVVAAKAKRAIRAGRAGSEKERRMKDV